MTPKIVWLVLVICALLISSEVPRGQCYDITFEDLNKAAIGYADFFSWLSGMPNREESYATTTEKAAVETTERPTPVTTMKSTTRTTETPTTETTQKSFPKTTEKLTTRTTKNPSPASTEKPSTETAGKRTKEQARPHIVVNQPQTILIAGDEFLQKLSSKFFLNTSAAGMELLKTILPMDALYRIMENSVKTLDNKTPNIYVNV